MTYDPQPAKTSQIELAGDLPALAERLGEQAHEAWARLLLEQGWAFGPERDEAQKTHPFLIPYPDLPAEERARYAEAARDELRRILALGFRIEPVEAPLAVPVPAEEEASSAIEEALEKSRFMNLSSLLALWRIYRAGGHPFRVETHEKLGQLVLRRGAPLVAYEVFADGLTRWPGTVRLRQLMGLALARSGATQRALQVLEELRHDGHADEETLGLLARTYKDLAEQATGPAERRRWLSLACEWYAQAYAATGGYWTGINAATMATLLDDRERGQQWAREVRTACLEELEQLTAKGEDAYWTLATLGEAALILEDDDEAADWYRRAAQAGSDRYGDLGSTRRNARLLLRHLRGDTSQIDRLLPVPRLAVLAGRPTAQASLPADRHEALREEVESRLVGANALIGYSSAGTEMDVLFSEALLAAGGEVHIVLPYDKDDFVRDTLETASDAEFGARLEAIVQCAAEIVTASQGKLEGGRVALDYADLMLFGLARLRALQLETDLIPFAFSSGSLEGDGVAAQLVRRWTSDGCPPEVIDLQGTPEAAAPPAAPMPPQTGFAGRILAILFADTVSFSRLTDVAVRRFVEYFLGAIAGLTTGDSFTPLAMNTWGDGLFGIFRSVREAGEYALALTELVTATDWESKGLPADLNVRIALHAGPVWSYTNPVTGKSDYIGTHVTRAARLEPITPPGNVYATYGFASLAAAEGVEGFACEYVGETPLAKSAGMCPTYHVRRRRG